MFFKAIINPRRRLSASLVHGNVVSMQGELGMRAQVLGGCVRAHTATAGGVCLQFASFGGGFGWWGVVGGTRLTLLA